VADAAPDLGTVLDDHIRLEETVLFPATLARRPRLLAPEPATDPTQIRVGSVAGSGSCRA
jgi:hypothetical protein